MLHYNNLTTYCTQLAALKTKYFFFLKKKRKKNTAAYTLKDMQ